VKRALLLVALVLAGCGSGAAQETQPKPPRLPRALAREWAAKADSVAAALAAGDGCTARTRAAALQQEMAAAVADRRVPRRFRGPLASGVDDLVSRISCTPPPAPAPVTTSRDESRGHGHGRGHDHGKHRGGHKHSDDQGDGG
jgi:hypothetical protein